MTIEGQSGVSPEEPAAERLRIRLIKAKDAELIWQWANDPSVRMNAFHQETISLETHLEWFRRRLASSDTRIWVLEASGVPVAQIRYDRVQPGAAEISFTVSADHRGRGFGTYMLIHTAERACRALGVRSVQGVAFKTNQASARAFIKAGFQQSAEKLISGHLCYVFTREFHDKGGESGPQGD